MRIGGGQFVLEYFGFTVEDQWIVEGNNEPYAVY